MPMEYFQGESYSLRGVAFLCINATLRAEIHWGNNIRKGEVKAWIIIKKQLN